LVSTVSARYCADCSFVVLVVVMGATVLARH
jgi:hypothetical protein